MNYTYEPSKDEIEVQLGEVAPTSAEESTNLSGVAVARTRDGRIARVRISNVQSRLLESLIHSVLSDLGVPDPDASVSIPDEVDRGAPGPDLLEAAPPATAKATPTPPTPTPAPAIEDRDSSSVSTPTAAGSVSRSGAGEAQPSPGVGTSPEPEGNEPTEPTGPTVPEPPPASFSEFQLLPSLLQSVANMGYTIPTPVQRRAVPIVAQGNDVIGLAQTGTGKTLAFVLPSLDRLLRGPDTGPKPQMLVLTPTRELALQVAEEAAQIAAGTRLSVTAVFGGRGFGPQIQALKAGTDVVVATPGRLLDHLNRHNVSLDGVRVLVLDEADRMLDMGFLDEVRAILRKVPRERQTLLFGATLPPAIERLSKELQNDPTILEVARQKPPDAIEQVLFPVERHLKTPLLTYLLKNEEELESVLIFTETKRDSAIVARQLREAGFGVALMHGDRKQQEREDALERLKSGAVRILVATNVAARGLDIDDISHVVNYDMPNTVDEYVHRIGRTARAHAEGRAYSFVSIEDQAIVARIESALERVLPRRLAEGFDYDVPTPSWAKPSADAVASALTRPKGRADVSRSFRPR